MGYVIVKVPQDSATQSLKLDARSKAPRIWRFLMTTLTLIASLGLLVLAGILGQKKAVPVRVEVRSRPTSD